MTYILFSDECWVSVHACSQMCAHLCIYSCTDAARKRFILSLASFTASEITHVVAFLSFEFYQASSEKLTLDVITNTDARQSHKFPLLSSGFITITSENLSSLLPSSFFLLIFIQLHLSTCVFFHFYILLQVSINLLNAKSMHFCSPQSSSSSSST